MTPTRTVQQRTDDFTQAFGAVQAVLVPDNYRDILAVVNSIPAPTQDEGVAGFDRYLAQINASLGISRMIASYDRTAAIVAAMLTQSGVSRPTFTAEGDPE